MCKQGKALHCVDATAKRSKKRKKDIQVEILRLIFSCVLHIHNCSFYRLVFCKE